MSVAALPETCASPGDLWIRPASAAYLGPSLELAAHTTAVHCFVLGVDGPFTLTSADGASVRRSSALIPPRVLHRVTAEPGERMLFYYADVLRAGADGLRARMRDRFGEFGIDAAGEGEVRRLCVDGMADGASLSAAVLGPRPVRLDPRIARTVERIGRDLIEPASAAALARAEGLSPSYFLRLFAGETGTSLRRYRLWARMLRVADALATGADLTRASADAGFASPSHFSDTFHRMFGLTATSLTGSGARLHVDRTP